MERQLEDGDVVIERGNKEYLKHRQHGPLHLQVKIAYLIPLRLRLLADGNIFNLRIPVPSPNLQLFPEHRRCLPLWVPPPTSILALLSLLLSRSAQHLLCHRKNIRIPNLIPHLATLTTTPPRLLRPPLALTRLNLLLSPPSAAPAPAAITQLPPASNPAYTSAPSLSHPTPETRFQRAPAIPTSAPPATLAGL